MAIYGALGKLVTARVFGGVKVKYLTTKDVLGEVVFVYLYYMCNA